MATLPLEYQRKWCQDHPEQCKQYARKRAAKMKRIKLENPNDPRIVRRREASRKYSARFRAKNPTYINEWCKARRKSHPGYRMLVTMRNGLNENLRKALFRGAVKSNSITKLLGCSMDSFLIYLESQFTDGMSWENYGKGSDKWNLEHTIPCALFDMTKPEHQKYCFHFSNLKPMWQPENQRKWIKCPPHLANNLSSLYESAIEGKNHNGSTIS